MAITIYDEPQLIASAGNPLVFTFSSDETAQPNFSFIVELYINSQLRLTQEVFRQFNTLGRIDVSEAVQSTLSSPLVTNGTLLTFYDMAINEYYIIVYEKYGATPTIQDSDTSTTLYGINAALRHQDFIAWDYLKHAVSTFNPNPAGEITWLTDWPRDRKFFLGNDERLFLGILNNDPGYFQVRFRLKDANNTIIANVNNITTANRFPIVDVSPQTIIDNTTITQADFDNCAYYEVIPRGQDPAGSFSGGGETFVIYMDRECKRYETKRLHWLNKYGVWDSFTFSLVSIDSTNVQSYGYQREKGVWNDTSYKYPLYQGEKIDFAKTASDLLTLNTDWIYQSVQQWLVRGLIESPSVYLEVDNLEVESCDCIHVSFSFDGDDYNLNVNRTGTFNDKPLYDFTSNNITFRLSWVSGAWKFFELDVQQLAAFTSESDCPVGKYVEFGESGVTDLVVGNCDIAIAFEPVKVTNTGYQFKTRRTDGLIQEQITLERTYTYTSQLN